MSAKEILVPDIGDFDNVDVIEVHISPGQQIRVDEPMITLENEKASMDLPATEAGVVKEVMVKVGSKVSQGSLICLLEPAEAAGQEAAKPSEQEKQVEHEAFQKAEHERAEVKGVEKAAPAASPTQAEPLRPSMFVPAPGAVHKEQPSFTKVHASPSIRRMAREKGVDLNRVKGTGRKGRITREDLELYLQKMAARPEPKEAAQIAGIPPVPVIDFSKFGRTEMVELSRIKRLTATAMTRSWLNVPHVTHNDEADVTDLEDFRKSLKAETEKLGIRVSILSFAMKAVVGTLKEFPTFNASLDPSGEHLILKHYYHIGIAVDTPNGLVVPVIRDVDQKSVFELSKELMEISRKARDNKLALADIQGATFTISSLGGIGGTTFTPIVNAPELAILGMTRSKIQPVWNGKEFKPRLMQPLSLSYDHRVIDGAEAARFCRHLATLLEDVRRLLL